MNRHDLKLEIDCIIHAAQAETGLKTFSDDGFVGRVGQMIDGYKKAGMDAVGEIIAAESIVDVIITHLHLIEDRRRYPEITEEKIERPVFIGGFPRSGTTFLYSLLATAPGARSPRWWDALHPSPPPGLLPEHNYIRRQIAQRENMQYALRCPGIKPAHSYFVNGADMSLECYMLWGLDFRSFAPFLFFRPPANPVLDLMGLGGDMVETYRFEKMLLQNLQWKRPTDHWVLKYPSHHFFLPQLFEVFPDATVIWPHRDPVTVFASAVEVGCIMMGGVAGVEMDRREAAKDLLPALAMGLEYVIESPLMDSPNVVHVRYTDLIRDEVATAKMIYERMGREYSPEVQANIAAYKLLPQNKSDYYGKFDYSLEKTGFSAQEVRHAFRKYIDRFDIESD